MFELVFNTIRVILYIVAIVCFLFLLGPSVVTLVRMVIRGIIGLVCRVLGLDPDPGKTEKVELLNDQIEHDRKILDHLYSHQANWDEVAEDGYQELKTEEAKMRKKMEALNVS